MKNIALCIAVLSIVSLPVYAAEPPDDWRWNLGIHALFSEFSGTTRFADATNGSGATIELEDVLEDEEFTAMISLSVERGSWGAFTEAMYMNLGATEDNGCSFTVSGSCATADEHVHLDMEGVVWTIGGSYSYDVDPDNRSELVLGARAIDIEQSIQWRLGGNIGSIPVAALNGNSAVELQNWDAIVGMQGRWTFGADNKWFVAYYWDIGTGESDVTVQALAGFGHSFGWGGFQVSARTLEYELESCSAVESLSFNGVDLKFVFSW